MAGSSHLELVPFPFHADFYDCWGFFIMNRTLFDCGFQQKVELRNGDLLDVTATLPKAVKLKYDSVRCGICSRSFFGKQYLDQHMRFKHPSECSGQESTDQSISLQSSNSPSNDVQEIEERRDDSSRSADEIHERRRGSATRKSYTVEFKKQTLHLLDSLSNSRNKWKKVAEAKQISKCLVIKWNKARDKILSLNKRSANAGGVRARQRRKMVGEKAKNSKRYPRATKLLVAEFKLRRAQESKISKLWMKSKMKKKIEMCYGKEAADKFKASDNWFQRFKRRNNISLRHRTNKKQHSADAARETIQKFHRNLRKAVKSKRRRSSAVPDRKYGRWMPKQRFNVDQVPLPFVVEQDRTYDFSGSKQIWVSQPGSGLDKRQATLQLCIRAEGRQTVKPAIVFRGKGNVSTQEREKYDKDIDVYFQPCAWMDSETNMKWTENTLKNGLKDDPAEKVLFADNVGFQQAQNFHEACRDLNTVVYLLPENHTDKVQPIDAGYGQMIKKKIGEQMEKWLEKEENLEMWHDGIPAKTRRVLMTKWAGKAWRELSSDEDFVKKLFEKTGCLMTADGEDDEKIRPQGLEPYTF